MEITNLSGHAIKHRPFDLRASMNAVGGQPLDERTEANLEYFFGRELERWSEFRKVPVLKRSPTHHSNIHNTDQHYAYSMISKGN